MKDYFTQSLIINSQIDELKRLKKEISDKISDHIVIRNNIVDAYVKEASRLAAKVAVCDERYQDQDKIIEAYRADWLAYRSKIWALHSKLMSLDKTAVFKVEPSPLSEEEKEPID